jgi:hypothetical protein
VSNVEVFRPKSGYLFAGMAFLMVSAMLYLQFIDYGFNFGFVVATLWGAFICSIFYQIFIYPKVVFFDEGVEIANPFSNHLIGWQDVEQIDTRYSFSIKTFGADVETKQIYAFAAPAPGRYHGRNLHQSELRGLSIEGAGSISAGQSPRTHSGVAAVIANNKLDEFRRAGRSNLIKYSYRFNQKALWINLLLLISASVLLFIHN